MLLTPLVGRLEASFGDLWRPLGGCLLILSPLTSLLSSLFSLSSWSCEAGEHPFLPLRKTENMFIVVVVLRRLDPVSRITHGFSLLSPLFSLLSSLWRSSWISVSLLFCGARHGFLFPSSPGLPRTHSLTHSLNLSVTRPTRLTPISLLSPYGTSLPPSSPAGTRRHFPVDPFDSLPH